MLEENIRKFQQQWKRGSGRSIAQRGKIAHQICGQAIIKSRI